MNILAGKSAYVPERLMRDMAVIDVKETKAGRVKTGAAQGKQVNIMMPNPFVPIALLT